MVNPAFSRLKWSAPNCQSLLNLGYHNWQQTSVEFGEPGHRFDLMIGWPNDVSEKDRRRIHVPTDHEERAIFGLLLNATQLEADETILKDEGQLKETRSDGNRADHSTLLRSLAEAIPQLSRVWDYCAILTTEPKQGRQLRLAALSKGFPPALRQNVGIELGQPLTGWAYERDYPIVVQKTTGSTDPRVAYQEAENASAAIAVPTHVRGQCNGILYVASRQDLSGYGDAFSEPEIRVLRIIADTVGETIEKNRIRIDSETLSYRLIKRPPRILMDWSDFKNSLVDALNDLVAETRSFGDNENLHLTIVRIESYDELRQCDVALADWAAEHILNTTREFFLRHNVEGPKIFMRHDDSPTAFVCLVPQLTVTDEHDRQMRDELRELLSSLTLRQSSHDSIQVLSYVWSMPFRKSVLQRKIEHDGDILLRIQNVASEIVREVEEAIVVVPFIEAGHKHEQNRAYGSALQAFLAAHYNAQENRYLMRHVAKTLFALGKLEESAEWWERLIARDPAARHYAKYAYILAAKGDYSNAELNYSRACDLDPQDAPAFQDWGDLLLIEGKVHDAIDRYQAAIKLKGTDLDDLWLRLAEAYFMNNDLPKAQMHANLVLSQNLDNQPAKRLMLQILCRMRRIDK